MLERNLILYSAPTLARLKTANLFTAAHTGADQLQNELDRHRPALESKGVRVRLLRLDAARALLYVYRPSQLSRDLNKPGVPAFLRQQGYASTDQEDALALLARRLQAKEAFPHEIGLFLGYPLGDVVGFIENQGRNCKCVGCWKVYCDECQARKQFDRFKKCQSIYANLYQQGRTLAQLTVADPTPS